MLSKSKSGRTNMANVNLINFEFSNLSKSNLIFSSVRVKRLETAYVRVGDIGILRFRRNSLNLFLHSRNLVGSSSNHNLIFCSLRSLRFGSERDVNQHVLTNDCIQCRSFLTVDRAVELLGNRNSNRSNIGSFFYD